ncbi:MAG: glucuronate isomerase [Clostridia bacterium]|nr:glucuronate isomerase [Clostridia bacterium]
MEFSWKKDLLLRSDLARKLYGEVERLPLIDYHNHLSLADIGENRRYMDVFDLWVAPDPYKHRAMRMCGIPEEKITGSAPVKEKFACWCSVFPKLLGNPLYIWSRMELELVFGITEIPCAENAASLYERCNAILKEKEITPAWFMERFGVEKACPCVSVLEDVTVLRNNAVFSPSLRGDDMLRPTPSFLKKLEEATGIEISDLSDFKKAVEKRIDAVIEAGCRFADLAIDNGFVFYPDDGENEKRFSKVLEGTLSAEEGDRLYSYLLVLLSGIFARRNLVLQLHTGAQRFTSTRLRGLAGAAGGFAAMGNSVSVSSLCALFDAVESGEAGLPKIVLFSLNPADDAMIATLSGSFSKDGVAGLITQGPAWWWCDHKKGMISMLENTASFGTLSNFVGMTTDSRSFLSFVRHDYFRRVLCQQLAEMVQCEDLICSEEELVALAKKLCYENAVSNWR